MSNVTRGTLALTPVNILLVDDDPRNLDVLESVLHSGGHRLVKAASGSQALIELLKEEFAVLVLDIQMPGMTGIELANLIKERERTRDIPIIFLTALFDDEERMMQSYGVGAVDFLSKPVNPAILRSKVGVFVELFRRTQSLRETNAQLAKEVARREEIERELRRINDELEARVEARTSDLQAANAETQRMARAKDDFLAALSHELRTPLNPVLLMASDASLDANLSATVRAQFLAIRKSIELEARLIDDLLDLTRITRGKMALTPEVVDVHAILSDAIGTTREEASQKRITLELDLQADPGLVVADAVRLQQVFWNILKNAVKFTPAGGKVAVSTRSAEEGPVSVSVKDNGIGLTEPERASIFDAFAQGEHASGGVSHAFGGLGLGLAISKRIIDSHKGSVRAESEGRDRGSTFIIELPRAPAGSEPCLASRSPFEPFEAKTVGAVPSMRRILLVEDHEPTRRTLHALLQLRQYEVASASTLAEARELASRLPFDVLVSDIGLPDGTGFELMAEMKRAYGLCGIALTGYGMDEDVGHSQRAGFRLHLTKPIAMQSLDEALLQLSGDTGTLATSG